MENNRRITLGAIIFLSLWTRPATAQDKDELDSLLGGSPAATPAAAPATPAAAPAPAAPPASAAPVQTSSQPPAGTAGTNAAPPSSEDVQHAAAPATAESAETVVSAPTAGEAGGKPVARRGSKGVVEEIIVTAQKRSENIQDVPIAIQAFTGDQLNAAGITSAQNLPKITPGLTYTNYAGYSIVYIRGVGTDAFLAADPAVPTYIDGIYYPFNQNLASSLGSVERIEVLKGPQGTLFGRNATGGAISIVTKQPNNEFRAEVDADYERFNNVHTRALFNIPLTNSLAITASGVFDYEPSYYKRYDSPIQAPVESTFVRAGSAKIGWYPTDSFKALLGYSYLSDQGELLTAIPISDVKPLGALLGIQQTPDYTTGADFLTGAHTKTEVVEAHLEYDAPWFDTKFIGADTRISSPAGVDFDGSNLPLVSFIAPGQISNLKSGEFQILSNDGSWKSDTFKWIAGFYFVDTVQGWDPLQLYVAPRVLNFLDNPTALGGPLASTIGALAEPLTQGLQSISNATGFPLSGFLDNGVTLKGYDLIGTRSYSGYLQGTVNFTDWVGMILGGRYQAEKRGLNVATTYVANPGDPSQAVEAFNWNSPLLGGPYDAKYHNVSPKVVLQFHPVEQGMAYLSYSKGYLGGTFNTVNLYVPPTYVQPESNSTYEIGYKGTFLDGSLQIDGAAFQNNLRNVQVQFISLLTGGAVRYETAPKARVRGFDFNAVWLPLPDRLPGLLVTLGGSFLDAKYTNYPDASGFDPTTGLYFGGTIFPFGGLTPGRNFSGNDLVRTPRVSSNLMVSYTFDFNSGSLELSNAAYYNSGFYFNAQDTPSSHQRPYVLDDVRISYLYKAWNLRFSLYDRNLTGAKYYITKQDIDFGTSALLAPPAVYGGQIQWRF